MGRMLSASEPKQPQEAPFSPWSKYVKIRDSHNPHVAPATPGLIR